MVLTYMGQPGVGKTTISRVVSAMTRIPLLSLGQLIRPWVSVERLMMEGDNPEAPQITAMLVSRLVLHAVNEGSVIIDGYPKSVDQLSWLYQICKPTCVLNVRWIRGPQRIEDRNESDQTLAKAGETDYEKLHQECQNMGIKVAVVENEANLDHQALIAAVEYVQYGYEWVKMKQVHDKQLSACLETLNVRL